MAESDVTYTAEQLAAMQSALNHAANEHDPKTVLQDLEAYYQQEVGWAERSEAHRCGSLECPRGVRGFLFWREYVAMGAVMKVGRETDRLRPVHEIVDYSMISFRK